MSWDTWKSRGLCTSVFMSMFNTELCDDLAGLAAAVVQHFPSVAAAWSSLSTKLQQNQDAPVCEGGVTPRNEAPVRLDSFSYSFKQKSWFLIFFCQQTEKVCLSELTLFISLVKAKQIFCISTFVRTIFSPVAQRNIRLQDQIIKK